MPLGRFDKVILYVQDMARMVAFYRDALDLPLTFPTGVADDALAREVWVTFALGSGCTLALHAGGQGRLGEDAPTLVFAVADIATAGAALSAAGARMAEPFEAVPGVLVAKGRDPEGNAFSLESAAS
jgi:predicted enzyme related to lactoylglutathione lyase